REALEVRNLLANPTFAAAATVTTGSNPFAVVTGDFNGDGKLDLATADYVGNSVSVLLGTGNGTFQAAQSNLIGSFPRALTTGDFNGDGKVDLAAANAGS